LLHALNQNIATNISISQSIDTAIRSKSTNFKLTPIPTPIPNPQKKRKEDVKITYNFDEYFGYITTNDILLFENENSETNNKFVYDYKYLQENCRILKICIEHINLFLSTFKTYPSDEAYTVKQFKKYIFNKKDILQILQTALKVTSKLPIYLELLTYKLKYNANINLLHNVVKSTISTYVSSISTYITNVRNEINILINMLFKSNIKNRNFTIKNSVRTNTYNNSIASQLRDFKSKNTS
jgi:hypothetical protein